jgi:hypothetical protein
MRDDRHKWDAPHTSDAQLTAPGVTISPVPVGRQTSISGTDVLSSYANCIGWPGVAQGPTYALSLRRDRILLVGADPMPDGWDDETGHAVSDATDAYRVLEISGPNAMALLKRGAEIQLGQSSHSVARLLFGYGTFLFRYGDEDTFRLHVSSAQEQAMWQTLQAHMTQLA